MIGGTIFVAVLLVFWLSPVRGITDSNYAMLLSESLLKHRSFALDAYKFPREELGNVDGQPTNGFRYQLELANGHVYYYFPPGSSVLSVPHVALMNALGFSAANADGTYSPQGELKIQAPLAALLMAALSVVFFATARLVLPPAWGALVALGGALGTQVWSTASRVLWTDTWAILLLGLAIFLLLRHEAGERRSSPVLLASLLAWTYFARPTNAVSVIAVTLYVLVFQRQLFLRYAATGALWLAAFNVYSWRHFGRLLPHYYQANRLTFHEFGTAIAGNLVSPSRGLLVYVPALLFVTYLLIRYRRYLNFPRLVLMAAGVIAVHLAAVSGFDPWWGGGCYGPRYTTGLVPWFVLVAILGARAMLNWRDAHRDETAHLRWRAQLAAGGALLALSVFMNARGALSEATWKWNGWPVNVDKQPGRVWDWSYPQFIAGLIRPPLGQDVPLVEAETRIDFTSQEAEKFLWYGWSAAEPSQRWSEEEESAIIFALARVDDTLLQMKLGAFTAGGRIAEQRVTLRLNGRRLETLVVAEEASKVYSVMLPKNLLRRENLLTFELPGAATPASFRLNSDERQLAIRVEWMTLQPKS
ncbi:MAG TPA: hypothetical protein VJT82_11795 [Pyrinomonadaceae bacterium]|nr:hypothetical protein [Pyrinomonadaceae bacterium]